MKYCKEIYRTKRWVTREVKVGDVGVGGENPIRIQSMTTSDTKNVENTTEQIMRLSDVGCEIARVTVQGKKEALACAQVKDTLIQKGYKIPLVADIHFYPPAAMLVVESVDKVRINPGNFVGFGKSPQPSTAYDANQYMAEIHRLEDALSPLVERCLSLRRAMRIGVNHGSLSERIMNRYGDTPRGMVESALEPAHICRKLGYHNFIFSMKASNPRVMIQAYRLLVAEMMRLGWNYPLHLGVTEAGDGEDGRVRSSLGIGALLLDGLGDTLRVSLTEDPWQEIDPCRRLILLAESYLGRGTSPFVEIYRDISKIERRDVHIAPPLYRDGSVIAARMVREGAKADAYFSGEEIMCEGRSISVIPIEKLSATHDGVVYIKDGDPALWSKLLKHSVAWVLLEMTQSILHQGRLFFEWIRGVGLDLPVILVGNYPGDEEDVIIRSSAEIGALLVDGLGEGVMLKTDFDASPLSFNILQACRMRCTKTEFVACPGCGRTLFNLQEVTRRIRSRISHLSGVKIAIMGCVVNGPGEMADADFGYVGSGRDKIDLYVGKACVEKNIHFSDAEAKLIELIKRHGRWRDPQAKEAYSEIG